MTGPAALSVAAFLLVDLLLATLVGRPWGPGYPITMDALVLLRLAIVFGSGLSFCGFGLIADLAGRGQRLRRSGEGGDNTGGQTPVKYWSNAGQILVKRWSNAGQNAVAASPR